MVTYQKRTSDITNIINYRPTALSAAMFKIIDFRILDILQPFLITSQNNLFSTDRQYSPDLCIVRYYYVITIYLPAVSLCHGRVDNALAILVVACYEFT